MKISISLGGVNLKCSIVKILAVLNFTIWILISSYGLYLLFDKDVTAIAFFTMFGSLLAGITAVSLAYFAYKGFGEWKIQTSLQYEHDMLLEFRDRSRELKVRFSYVYTHLVLNREVFLKSIGEEEFNIFYKKFGEMRQKLNDELRIHAQSYFVYKSIGRNSDIKELEKYEVYLQGYINELKELDFAFQSIFPIYLVKENLVLLKIISNLTEIEEHIPGIEDRFVILRKLEENFAYCASIKSIIEKSAREVLAKYV